MLNFSLNDSQETLSKGKKLLSQSNKKRKEISHLSLIEEVIKKSKNDKKMFSYWLLRSRRLFSLQITY